MSKQKISYTDRLRFAFGAALALTALPVMFSNLIATRVFAYGPERAEFRASSPADYVTFNSMVDNPTVGDERNFVRVRKVGDAQYSDSVDIIPGQEYEVYIYYHNNAKSSLNTRANNFKGIALDAKLKTALPATIAKGQTAQVYAEISASNAKPQKVWDESTLRSPSRDVALRYVMGSAKITTKGGVNGHALASENLFGQGTNLGYDALNGVLPGCDQYSGYVTYRFKADYADFEMSKTVSKSGANNWVNSQGVSADEEVEFKISYKNTGTVTQKSVNIKDQLPVGMTIVPGTTKVSTSSNSTPKTISDNIASNGINIGDYTPGATATVTFRAKIDASKLVCGANTLTNTAQVITENGTKQDTASVAVQKNCTNEEKEKCQVVGKTHLDKNDPKCTEKCTVKGKENLDKDDKDCFEPCQIKGKEHLKKDDPKCIETCDIKGKESLPKNDPKCFEPCPIKGKENLKKDDPRCNDPCPVKGKEHLKANDKDCYAPCTVKGKENLKSTDANCVEPCRIQGKEHLNSTDPLCGETPVELPKTGPAEAIAIIVAITAISGAIAYWFRSHEEMKKATVQASKKKSEK